MGTNECSQSASKSSWDSQDFGDVNMVLKWPIFTGPLGHNELSRYIEWNVMHQTMLDMIYDSYLLVDHVQSRSTLIEYFAIDAWIWHCEKDQLVSSQRVAYETGLGIC